MKIFSLNLIFFIVLIVVGCHEEEDFPSIEISATIQHVNEFGADNGSIDLEITGGVPPFSFLWSNKDTTEDLTNVSAGKYSVNVYDSANQIVSDTFEVTQPAPDSLSLVISFVNPSGTGAEDGEITVNVGGGYSPYSFLWNTGVTSQNLEDLPAGTFIINITDNIGQVLTDTVVLSDMVTDIDGNTYTIQKIGDQKWMGENLRVEHAPDSSPIESYIYNNDTIYELKYGRLYTWNAAMNGSAGEGAQGICPCGWHIPTDEEFKKLEMHLGMSQAEANLTNTWRGAPVGSLLKVGGNSGYEAQMSGRRSSGGAFSLMGSMEYMWTSSEYGSSMAWRRCLNSGSAGVGRWNTFPKSYGFSVRCIKNEE